MNRRGFTLIELLVAALLTMGLAVAVGGIVAAASVRLRDRTERAGLEHALRVALLAGRAAVRELGADSASGADLLSVGGSSLILRATRASGVLCGAAPDGVVVRNGPAWWRARRAPVPGRDSLLIAPITGPARWAAVSLSGPPAAGVCPDGGLGLVLPTVLAPAALAAVGPGSPLRVFEPVELRAYGSSGAQWIGLRLVSTGESIQPLAGPFLPGEPVFGYEGRAGGPVSDPAEVALIRMALTGVSERAGGVGIARLPAQSLDRLSLAVGLRGLP